MLLVFLRCLIHKFRYTLQLVCIAFVLIVSAAIVSIDVVEQSDNLQAL